MSLRDVVAIAAGRLTRRAVLLLRPGGATAIPGRVVERLSPRLLARILSQPRVVAVTGSSGKGTTTKMVTRVLEAHGVDVFTNEYAGNITRGMLSELLRVVDWRGRFPHDVAVMEMDEGYSALTTEQAPAEVTVLLNVMVDQLHRWQEPERVASYLERTARATTGTVVVNRDDPQLARVASRLPRDGARVRYFSVSEEVQATIPHGLGSAPEFGTDPLVLPDAAGESTVVGFEGLEARIAVSDAATVTTELPSRGIHFAVDQAAAIEAARAVLGDDFDAELAARALSAMPTVFGRGEEALVKGQPAEFVLTKSPTSIQINLDMLGDVEQLYVDIGRDILDGSQLWLSDWSGVDHVDMVSGWQTWDMAMKLVYDGVEVRAVDDDPNRATDAFFALPAPSGGAKTVIFTPESMRRMRRYLGFYSAETKKVDAGGARMGDGG